MYDKNLPTDMLNIIFKFAYNIKMKTDPIKDIELQKNIQESIPPCFLMSRLPKPEWFTTQNHPLCGPCWKNCNIHRLCDKCVHNLDCILVPSPFKKGNPYYPTCGIDPTFPKWSPAIGTFVDLLSRHACRKNHCYKACLLRKVEKMFTQSVLLWNEYFGQMFNKEFMLEPNNFFRKAYPWSDCFITKFCEELSMAQFLPLCSNRHI